MKKMKNSQGLKEININEDGTLDFNAAIELYKQYLCTPRLDWQEELRRPVKINIFKAMCATHAKLGQNPQSIIQDVIDCGGKLFFWSDLHLFHNNIIRYASRPFESVDHMNQTMIGNYWSTVTENDVVVFGGDVGFGEVSETIKLIQSLPGKKVLVLGNHDFDRNQAFFRNYHSFDKTTMAFVIHREIDGEMWNIIVSHYPIHETALPKRSINIHGHIHQHLAGNKNINMSVEHTFFAPISMDSKIEDLINKIKAKKNEK